ncbi:MAG: hypothetical protein ACREBU_22300, partial [Nitrososphaera sp.]
MESTPVTKALLLIMLFAFYRVIPAQENRQAPAKEKIEKLEKETKEKETKAQGTAKNYRSPSPISLADRMFHDVRNKVGLSLGVFESYDSNVLD